MNTVKLIVIVCLGLLTGCESNSSGDIDRSRSYVKEGVYRLNKPAFLFKTDKQNPDDTVFLAPLGFSGTPSDLSSFMRSAPNHPQAAGLLMPGELIQIQRFLEIRSSTLGVFLQVYGEIITGENAGVVLELSMISLNKRPSSEIFVNNEYLERVQRP